MDNCKDSWFDQRAVFLSLAEELRSRTTTKPFQPKAMEHTRKRKVQTASIILYSKDEQPVVISKHPTKKNKYLVEGLA